MSTHGSPPTITLLILVSPYITMLEQLEVHAHIQPTSHASLPTDMYLSLMLERLEIHAHLQPTSHALCQVDLCMVHAIIGNGHRCV